MQNHETERNSFVRLVEDNNTLWWTGVLLLVLSLTGFLVEGNNPSSIDQAAILAGAITGLVAASLGSESD
ncbi:hypothetical protein M1615_02565 [Patescibacteria group bacterium]|nr:hypothetical protein [Patescibacteria group bacterium]